MPATTEIYTLSLHDALPICRRRSVPHHPHHRPEGEHRHERRQRSPRRSARDRKSTRLNSSHVAISYAVFCLKKKKSCLHRFRLNLRVELIFYRQDETSTGFP